jgi:hypothetical protein
MTGFIYKYKTDAMHRLCALLAKGYVYYTRGVVSLAKAQSLHDRFEQRYDIYRDRDRRYRCKQQGITNTFLVMYYCSHDQVVRWWLVNTTGHASVNKLEQLKDARERHSRLPFAAPKLFYEKHGQEPSVYELVRIKRKIHRNNPMNKSVWTWQLQKDAYERQVHQLCQLVSWVKIKDGRRTNDSALIAQLDSLKRTPGFHRTRRQAFALFQQTKKRWRRVQKGDWPYGEIYVGWVGRYQSAERYPVSYFQEAGNAGPLAPTWSVPKTFTGVYASNECHNRPCA